MNRKGGLLMGTFLFAGFSAALADPVDIGGRREVFWDHALIASMTNTTLRLQPPTDEGVVMRFNKPWEGRYCGLTSVFQDGPTYKLYYRGWPTPNHSDINICCAESTNGIDWVRPNLGLKLVSGTYSNNCLSSPGGMWVFIDTKPGVPASERYKGLRAEEEVGLFSYVSADGLNFTQVAHSMSDTEYEYDTLNLAFYSEAEGRYVCWFRDWSGPTYFSGYRRIRRGSGETYTRFTDEARMEYVYYDGLSHVEEHHYIPGTFPYFRAPNIYVSLSARFLDEVGGEVPPELRASLGIELDYYESAKNDRTDSIFMTTRPGATVYDRLFPERYVVPAAEIGPQMARSNFAVPGVVPTGPREMSFYMQHAYASTNFHMRRYSLRLDGFVAASVTNGTGELLTKPLVFDGHSLRLNYRCRGSGWLKVEIRDTNGVPISGYAEADADALTGDEIEGLASWNGSNSLLSLEGEPVELRFVMQNADLFAMRFGNIISNTAVRGLTATSAELRGGLDGGTTTVGVAWGPAADATNGVWAETRLLGEQSAGALSYDATNLTSDTRYGYAFFVTNAAGVGWAEPAALFSTEFAAEDAPAGLSALAVGARTVTLGWQDNSASETGFRLERDTGGGGWLLEQQVPAGVTNAVVTGLVPATIYDFRVQAVSEGTASDYSNTARVQTLALDTADVLVGGVPNPDFMAGGTNVMCLWLDADDASTVSPASGGTVTAWTDKSNNGKDVGVIADTPTYTAPSGSGTGKINFGGYGSSDAMTVPGTPLPNGSLTVFFVVNPTTPTDTSSGARTYKRGGLVQADYEGGDYNGFQLQKVLDASWGAAFRDTGDDYATVSAPYTTGNQLWAAIVDYNPNPGTTTLTLYKNGVQVGTDSRTDIDTVIDPSADDLYIMWWPYSGGTRYLGGDVYEILAYSTALSSNDHNAVGWYLQGKWGIGSGYTDTVPTNELSTFRITAISNLLGRALCFDGVSGRTYRAHWSTNLLSTNWWLLPGTSVTVTADGAVSITDTNEAAQRFYRVTVE